MAEQIENGSFSDASASTQLHQSDDLRTRLTIEALIPGTAAGASFGGVQYWADRKLATTPFLERNTALELWSKTSPVNDKQLVGDIKELVTRAGARGVELDKHYEGLQKVYTEAVEKGERELIDNLRGGFFKEAKEIHSTQLEKGKWNYLEHCDSDHAIQNAESLARRQQIGKLQILDAEQQLSKSMSQKMLTHYGPGWQNHVALSAFKGLAISGGAMVSGYALDRAINPESNYNFGKAVFDGVAVPLSLMSRLDLRTKAICAGSAFAMPRLWEGAQVAQKLIQQQFRH